MNRFKGWTAQDHVTMASKLLSESHMVGIHPQEMLLASIAHSLLAIAEEGVAS